MDDLRQVGVILQESRIFVRKEVSIANSTELTKLYILLTDSLRLISIQSAAADYTDVHGNLRNLCTLRIRSFE